MTDKPDSPTNPHSQNDAELLRRFHVQQDQAAFTTLVEKYAPLVMGVCRRVLRDAGEAEDCFQQVFLTLALKGQSIRDRDSFVGWLFTVAHREAVSRYQQRDWNRNVRLREELMQDSGEHPNAKDHELATALQEEISRLPDKYQGPIVLCYLEGRSREETARELGATDSSVKARLERGRNLLRKRLLKRGLVYTTALAAWQSTSLLSAGTISSGLIAQTVALSSTKAAAVSTGLVSSSPLPSFNSGMWKLMALSKKTKIAVGTALGFIMLIGTGAGLFLAGGSKTSPPNHDRGSSPVTTNSVEASTPESVIDDEYLGRIETFDPPHACAAKFVYFLQTEQVAKAADIMSLEEMNEIRSPRSRVNSRAHLMEELQEMSSAVQMIDRSTPLRIDALYVDNNNAVAITEDETFPITEEQADTGGLVIFCQQDQQNRWRVYNTDFTSNAKPSRGVAKFMEEHPNVESKENLAMSESSEAER